MQAYFCSVCGYLYDDETAEKHHDTGEAIPFEELDTEWTCPVCAVAQRLFQPYESEKTIDIPNPESEK